MNFMMGRLFPIPARAVLFDLDGVLVDSFQYWFRLFNQTLEHFGHAAIGLGTFRKSWGQSTAEDIRIFMPEQTLPEVRAYFNRHRGDHVRLFKADPRARAVLGELRGRGFRLACVTNSHRPITLAELNETGLRRYFKVILTADDVLRPKPHPEMLIEACRRLGITPRAAVFVGDTRTDRRAGRSAGCAFIGYRMVSARSIERLDRLPGLLKGVG